MIADYNTFVCCKRNILYYTNPLFFHAIKNPAPQSVQGIQSYSVVYGNKAITLARLIATVRAL